MFVYGVVRHYGRWRCVQVGAMGGLKTRWNWISPPIKVKVLEDIKVEDLAFGWKHTIVLGTPR